MVMVYLYYAAEMLQILLTREQGMNRDKLGSLMCVFCLGFVADEIDYSHTQICEDCFDYKGVTTVREYLTEHEGLVFA
jgi:hypothetical protein